MKRIIVNARQKTSIVIISLLLLANLFAFGVASKFLKKSSSPDVSTQVENTTESGWQVLGWGASILEYFTFDPQN
ncbi:MAG: hypothetical protein H6607_10085 [Flavobacteriales bacterium]|nr:hypothetical protein [Flavobacteriales bacterium]